MTKEEAIKEAYGIPVNKKQHEALQILIPELAESDDERIRKSIVSIVNQYARVCEKEGDPCEASLINDALAYLEKQKNQKSSEWSEEDERMISVIRLALTDVPEERFTTEGTSLSKVLAWIEKQKENPKSADSIQSDCVSDAKCKNRWHKVADSLPDSAREVICKDAIGNFFIGRYYKGSDSWEVSMYDDADKSNEDNPPVIMWCDIPSEMQNEQKPETKLTGWVARDSEYNPYSGLGLVLFNEKPRKYYDCWRGAIASQLPWESFPDLKWEDEPMKVEITIRKK